MSVLCCICEINSELIHESVRLCLYILLLCSIYYLLFLDEIRAEMIFLKMNEHILMEVQKRFKDNQVQSMLFHHYIYLALDRISTKNINFSQQNQMYYTAILIKKH